MVKRCRSVSLLARGIWGTKRDPRQSYMALFKTYYDASGSQSSLSNSLVVIGLLATEAKWLRFEPKWEAVLEKHGVTAHHHKDYTNCPDKSEFASWKDDHEQRKEYLTGLLAALKRGINKGFIVVVPVGAFEAVNKEVKWDNSLYGLAADLCSRHAEKWIGKKHQSADLHHFFEEGDTGQDVFRGVLEFRRMTKGIPYPMSIVPKVDKHGKRLRQFEAADLIAWEVRRWSDDMNKVRGPSLRQSFTAILKDLPLTMSILDAKKMLPICRTRPDLFPPRR
jgi:hypothetical protein